MKHANWLFKGAKGSTLGLFDIPSTSDMYVRAEVSVEESLKVGDIQLNVQGKTDWIPQRTVTKVGLYEISSTMEQWCDDKTDALIAIRDEKGAPLTRSEILPVFCKDREWINDDSLLIEECIDRTTQYNSTDVVALISKDKRLANQMSRQANVSIALIDPASLVKAFPNKTWCSTSQLTSEEVFAKYPKTRSKVLGQKPKFVLIDFGSLASSLSNLEKVDDGLGGVQLYRVDPVSSRHLDDGRREEVVKRTAVFEPSTLSFLSLLDPRKKDLFKRSAVPFGRDSASLSSYAWSESDTLRFSSRVTRRGKRSRASA
jgi:hypothetical protein